MNESEVVRLMDVNLNRAAEGLRTLEDIARVVRFDASAAAWSKSLRHELAGLASQIPRTARLMARTVHSDVGTSLSTDSETLRSSWSDLVVSAAERVSQSLRVLEESSKRYFPDWSIECKQFRYRAYDRLAQIELRLTGSGVSFQAPSVYLLVDCQLEIELFSERLRSLAAAGVGLFQVRDKLCEATELLRYCTAAVSAVGAERVIVNDRVDVALACGAGGVHIGQQDLPLESVQQLAGDRLWIGVSTHDVAQAKQAQAAGADYVGCGPTFPSSTKRFSEFSGLEFLQAVAKELEIPAYAIGGINAGNLPSVLAAGFARIAVSGAVWQADLPVTEAKKLISVLDGHLSMFDS